MIKLYGRIQPKRLFGEVKINYGAYNGKLQAKTVAPSQEEQTVFPDSGFKGLSHVIVEAATLQEKTIKPSGIEQTVVPDVGVYGLSKVIVEAQGNHGLLEDKTVSPSEEEQILEPSDGYYGIQSVTVKAAPLEEKTATSTDQDQIVKPSEGFYGMDQVIVKGIPNAEDYTFSEAETFPAIPTDALAANPYALIAKTMIGGAEAYLLAVSASAFFYGKQGAERGLGTYGSGTMYYVTVGGVAWSKVQEFTAGNGVAPLGESDALMWANHEITDVNEGFTYFAKSDVYPAASAEVYRIQKETADDIGREINRLWKTAEPMTAERMKEKLADLDIELTELTVYPTDEVQEITPDGYYGFSKIIVEAVEDSGGSGGGSGEGDDEVTNDYAENTTFGDEYVTGNYDYSSGKDENPSYIPEIPGDGEYKLLFNKKLKAGKLFRYTWDGVEYDLKADADVYVYNAFGTYGKLVLGSNVPSISDGIYVYSPKKTSYVTKRASVSEWSSNWRTLEIRSGFNGYFSLVVSKSGGGNINTGEIGEGGQCKGLAKYDVGNFNTSDELQAALYNVGVSKSVADDENEQFIAFSSKTQILCDGSVIKNADNSPMTIYEVDAADTNTWVKIGETDGGEYPIGSYTVVWNSHDLLDSTGEFITRPQSDAPVAETSPGGVAKPVERNETYLVDGNTMNSIVGAAQRVTGNTAPMTPDEAADALDKYYSQPAEVLKW